MKFQNPSFKNFLNGRTDKQTDGQAESKKKNTGNYFLTRNPYMKFQNPSFKIFLNGRTDKQTDGQAESNMLPTFSKLGA